MERIRSAVKKLNKKKTAQARSTVVFQSSKKNLAYYDPEIYDRLKQRKQTVVRIEENVSFVVLVPAETFLFRLLSMTEMQRQML